MYSEFSTTMELNSPACNETVALRRSRPVEPTCFGLMWRTVNQRVSYQMWRIYRSTCSWNRQSNVANIAVASPQQRCVSWQFTATSSVFKTRTAEIASIEGTFLSLRLSLNEVISRFAERLDRIRSRAGLSEAVEHRRISVITMLICFSMISKARDYKQAGVVFWKKISRLAFIHNKNKESYVFYKRSSVIHGRQHYRIFKIIIREYNQTSNFPFHLFYQKISSIIHAITLLKATSSGTIKAGSSQCH